MKTKKCIKCENIKNIYDFQLRPDTGKRRNQCKICRNHYVKIYKRQINNNERQKNQILIANNKKKCILCKEYKNLINFPKRNTEHGYRHQCKECKHKYIMKNEDYERNLIFNIN